MAAKQRASDAARDFFKKLAKTKTPAPVYLLHGAEGFLLDMALARLQKTVLPAGINDFNYDIFYGKEADGGRVVAACDTLALFGGRRMVVVREIHRVPQADLDAIITYLANPAPSTTLICHGQTNDAPINKSKRFYRTVAKVGVAQEFRALREWEVGTFLTKQARGRGLEISRSASDALISSVGSDLALLDGALEKVDLYLGSSDSPRQVDDDVLEAVIAVTRNHDVFELTDAIAGRDVVSAMTLIDRMLGQGPSAIGINLMVARQLRQLLALKIAAEQRLSKAATAKAAGVNPYFLDKLARAAAGFSQHELRAGLDLALATDRRLKSSRLSSRTLLEQMIINVCA